MAEVSAISWTDATFNPWIGCTKISPACEHCYAASDNKRRKWVADWGEVGKPATERRRTKTWGDPLKWNRKAAQTGYKPRVFCASLADVFDNEAPQAWREDLWRLIGVTDHLRWILLTKRIGNVEKMIDLTLGWPFSHVGLMATLENQQVWDRDYAKLASLKLRFGVRWIGVSVEPMLGRIDIGDACPDWIITGGESGAGFRPLDMDAVRFMRDQCAANGIAFHHKQNGGFRGKDSGCMIDGVEHKHFPPALTA